MEAIRNSKESFVRPKQLIWYGGTYRQTDRHTHRQTDPCIELRYAQLIKCGKHLEQEKNVNEVSLVFSDGCRTTDWSERRQFLYNSFPVLRNFNRIILTCNKEKKHFKILHHTYISRNFHSTDI